MMPDIPEETSALKVGVNLADPTVLYAAANIAVTQDALKEAHPNTIKPGAPDAANPDAADDDDNDDAPGRVTKKLMKRAARACVACRARKVRCDVVERTPCGNCRWDNVECILQDGRRWKKRQTSARTAVAMATARPRAKGHGCDDDPVEGRGEAQLRCLRRASPVAAGANGHVKSLSMASESGTLGRTVRRTLVPKDPHVRQPPAGPARARVASNPLPSPSPRRGDSRAGQFVGSLQECDAGSPQLPPFVKPLPPGIGAEDVRYMHAKGALALPSKPLQRALLGAYVEFAYPCLPLLDLPEFLSIIGSAEGPACGAQVSLLLYQAVMFAGAAFVDENVLRVSGFSSRRSARRCFFQRTKLLYDLDYESDRLILVQALLLMTYWFERPEQKDMWHWIGAAVSLAYTIGLHHDPAATGMPTRKQRLWKRIWWSCFIRDRLISLGFRRPTRITDESFDIPMLEESDFEIEALPLPRDESGVIPSECTLLCDTSIQLELAAICVAMAKLCTCVGNMLRVQDAVLAQDRASRPYASKSMVLAPNKQLDLLQSVAAVDFELMAWAEALPASCRYQSPTPFHVRNGRSAIAVQRVMLHMIYYATISVLHRTQFLASPPIQTPRQAQDISRLRVHNATTHVARMASELYELRLERYLPTTGVTVILPAMIVQLLELKSPLRQSRERAAHGFRQCMRVIKSLRDTYAAADHAVGLFEASLRNSGIDLNTVAAGSNAVSQHDLGTACGVPDPPAENEPYMTSYEVLFRLKPAHYQSLQTTDAMPECIVAAALDLPNTKAGGSSAPTHKHPELTVSGMTSIDTPQDVNPLLPLDFSQAPSDIDFCGTGLIDLDLSHWLDSPLNIIGSNEEFMANIYTGGGRESFMEWSADMTRIYPDQRSNTYSDEHVA